MTAQQNIQPRDLPPKLEVRKDLDFGIDETLDKHWNRNDAFKTRIMDGLQLTFPEGERYFIKSVRTYRDQIKDPQLLKEVQEFIQQEAQHGIAHTHYNDILAKQGMPMDEILADQKETIRQDEERYSDEFNIALTAALEHFTALLADTYFAHKSVTQGMDPRMRALFAWHAIEEMEHRSVAFDVMQKVAKVGYFKRCWAMIIAIKTLNRVTRQYTSMLLEADGFSRTQQIKMFIKNLGWLYGRRGILSSFAPSIVHYFKPGFHPEDIPVIHNYGAWVKTYSATQDPRQACDALMAAAY